MHGSNTLSAVSLGVVECITSDTLGSLPGNKLDRLNNAIDNLKFGSDKPVSSRLLHETHLVLNARVLSLGVFTDKDSVDVVVGSLEALD